MDEIIIKNLTVFANHGVFEAEAQLGQKFVVSAVLYTDISKPGRTDCLENTIHYGFVSADITRFLTENRFQLLESCAQQLAEHLLIKYPAMTAIDLEIQKPWAPVHLPLDTVAVKVHRGWHTAFLALGSNMGDREANLQLAVDGLNDHPLIRLEKTAAFLSTEPYGYTQQDTFLNSVCMVRTTLNPQELLDVCHELETKANRQRLIHWGPRTLDVDVLFYDREVIATETLNVPHPDMANRDFVLKPMAEIAPWWLHPITGKTMAQMLAELEKR